ncbi:MAG: tetratricopeptide repeat protein [Gammaproteobacteria bacterium]|nr:tetratricopeptide repeat protein [Gammaproteobacteria bacterium]MCZ6881135.1 tetratricopeptide repeat protein [Gammaproteobacteria bacterium]
MDPTAEERLQQANRLQQQGRLEDAAGLYQALASEYPHDPQCRFGLAMVEVSRANPSVAVGHLKSVLQIAPEMSNARRWMGRCLRVLGKNDEAVRCFEICTDEASCDPGELLELGEARLAAGQTDRGRATLQNFVEQSEDHAEAMLDAGLSYHQAGLLDEAAAQYRQALDREPELQLARRNLAAVFQAQGRLDEAESMYRQVLETETGNHEVWQNLGTLLKDKDQLADALNCYERAMRLYRLPCPGDLAMVLQQNPEAKLTSLHHLKLQAEQLEYLRARGRLSPANAGLAGRYREVIAEIETARPTSHRIVMNEEQFKRIGPTNGRLMHLTPANTVPGGALNPDLDFAGIDGSYCAKSPGLVVIDNFLKADALKRLRDYCLESTVWFDFRKAGGYCGSYMQDGFGNDLLMQLAGELREKLPQILGQHPLNQMWGYIYDSEMSGITAHADAAAVNLNFWITPDEANEDPDSGGLIVYTKEAPVEWDFDKYNNEYDAIEAFAKGSDTVVVTHRCNRAVLFHSNLIHKTDNIRFKTGLENRRINITMLFGQRASAPSIPGGVNLET